MEKKIFDEELEFELTDLDDVDNIWLLGTWLNGAYIRYAPYPPTMQINWMKRSKNLIFVTRDL